FGRAHQRRPAQTALLNAPRFDGMRHNVLVLLTARLPDRRDERRDLGLPVAGRRPGGRRIPGRAAAENAAWCRVEGLTTRQSAALAAAMRRSGGTAATAPSRRTAPGLTRRGLADPGRAVVLHGGAADFEDLLERAPRIGPDLAPEIR